MNEVKDEYNRLSEIANIHISTLKDKHEVTNTKTLAAAMFIQSHKYYIRGLFDNIPVYERQDAAVKFIKLHVTDFDEAKIRKELSKIGLIKPHTIIKWYAILFTPLYIGLSSYYHYDDINSIGICITYSVLIFLLIMLISIGCMLLVSISKMPFYLKKDL